MSTIDSVLSDLERGNSLHKLRCPRGQIQSYKRTFKLDRIEECITWQEGSASETNPNSSRKISISNIKEVVSGHQTDIFIKVKNGGNLSIKKSTFRRKDLDITEQKCFSINFHNDSLPLDLVAEDVETANKWVQGLNYYLQRHESGSILKATRQSNPFVSSITTRVSVEASELSILKTGDVEDSVLPKIIVPSAHSVPDETETRSKEGSTASFEMVPRFRQGGEWAGNWYDKSCILLFGDTGLGKSTILNLVTGHKVQTGDGVNGTTEENSIYNNFLHPERPKWMDTVGLNEARYNQDPFEVCQTYLRMLKDKDIESIHAIIWVIPVSEKNTTNIQQQAVYIQTLFENFGQTRTKDIWKNVIIVCRGTFNKNDFQGAHAAITDILKDNSKRARSMTCINMLPFEEISLSDLNLDCEAATKMRSDLEGALGSIESPLPLNFCDKVCVDCGQTDDPRLMDKECHLGQEIVEVPCCSSCLFAWCCCLNCTKQTIQCRNANCKTKDNKRSEWKKRKMLDVSKYNDVDYHNCAIVEMIGNRRIETPRNIPSHLRKEKHILKDPDSIKQTKCCF